jgi:nicotinamide mononucleotide (NMN) deamidase PncC
VRRVWSWSQEWRRERSDSACRDDRGAPEGAARVRRDCRVIDRRPDLGGAVAYTRQAKILLLGLDEAALTQFRPATEPHALLLARGAQARFAAAWGLGETGATGPIGNRYGDPAGHTCLAVAGTVERAITLETGRAERLANMHAFAAAALKLLADTIPQ